VKTSTEKEKKEDKGFSISVRDNEAHKYLWSIRFTKTGFFITIISFLVMVIAATYCVIAYTPVRTFIPGYPDARTKRTAIQNAIKVDSLEKVIYRWELYSENLKRAVEGKAPIRIDSVVNASKKEGAPVADEAEMARKDSLLREQVKKEEKFEISERGRKDLPIEGLHFFTPLKGVISQGYDPVHPYIDITAPAGSVVKATLDGTVIYAGWSQDSGNTIQLQHSDDIVSIYKHNEKLLKKVGEKVKAGTSIALVGNTGDNTTGTHLHFELWHKGETVDPTMYIKF
jgi:murein DD-endopeptidase MepM/ murein hydrolase activator NlpD